MKILLGKKYYFSALHELPAECKMTDIKMHGHDYELEVVITGPIEAHSQWIFSRDLLDEIVERKILRPLNRTFLNRIFAKTSGEALCHEVYKILRDDPDLGPRLHRVSLQETLKNRFTTA